MTLIETVKSSIRYGINKRDGKNLEDGCRPAHIVEAEVEAEINSWSMLELLDVISQALDDARIVRT